MATLPDCHLFKLPQDIFRVIFQYLSVYNLMKGEEAFLNNQELLSLYRSSLEGFTLKDEVKILNQGHYEILISWLVNHKLLVESLELWYLTNFEINRMGYLISSLKSLSFNHLHSSPDLSQLRHFPLLTSLSFVSSNSFNNPIVISLFSLHPQLEIVDMIHMTWLSNEIIPALSYYCPNLKILSLKGNSWVNAETLTLLSPSFPNLKSLDLRHTSVRNEDSLRQFILSHPQLPGLFIPSGVTYSDDFLKFFFNQAIFPSILKTADNDQESHSLAILSFLRALELFRFRKCDILPFFLPSFSHLSSHFSALEGPGTLTDSFTPEILSHLFRSNSTYETLQNTFHILERLARSPILRERIITADIVPNLRNYLSLSENNDPDLGAMDLLSNCCDASPHLLVTHHIFSSILKKFHSKHHIVVNFCWGLRNHLTLMTPLEVTALIPILFHQFKTTQSYSIRDCLSIISIFLQQSLTRPLIDPNELLLSLKSLPLSSSFQHNYKQLFECLKIFISVKQNHSQLVINSNLIPDIMRCDGLKEISRNGMHPIIDFATYCLFSSEELSDHLVESGAFQFLLSHGYEVSVGNSKKIDLEMNEEIVRLFELLVTCSDNKYLRQVTEMKLPKEIRCKLYALDMLEGK